MVTLKSFWSLSDLYQKSLTSRPFFPNQPQGSRGPFNKVERPGSCSGRTLFTVTYNPHYRHSNRPWTHVNPTSRGRKLRLGLTSTPGRKDVPSGRPPGKKDRTGYHSSGPGPMYQETNWSGRTHRRELGRVLPIPRPLGVGQTKKVSRTIHKVLRATWTV